MARKFKPSAPWYRNDLAAHKRTMAKPMRPVTYKPNAEAKAVEYALWLLQRDGIDLDALAAPIIAAWNEGAKPVGSYRAIRGAYTRRSIAPDAEIIGRVLWAPCDAGSRPFKVRFVIDHPGTEPVYELELPHWNFVAAEPCEQMELAA